MTSITKISPGIRNQAELTQISIGEETANAEAIEQQEEEEMDIEHNLIIDEGEEETEQEQLIPPPMSPLSPRALTPMHQSSIHLKKLASQPQTPPQQRRPATPLNQPSSPQSGVTPNQQRLHYHQTPKVTTNCFYMIILNFNRYNPPHRYPIFLHFSEKQSSTFRARSVLLKTPSDTS